LTLDIIRDIASFFSLLSNTVKLLRYGVKVLRETKSLELHELSEEIASGNLEFGTRIVVNAVFSDFVPIARHLAIPTQHMVVPLDPLPCRPFPIHGSYCASIQPLNSKCAGATNGFPIFYKDSTRRPVLPLLSGLTVEVKGTLTSIPNEWSQLLELRRPACLDVDSIEIIGSELQYFGLIPWAIAKLKVSGRSGQGQLIHGAGSWTYSSHLTPDTYFLMCGSGPTIRHGKSNESWDTVYEFCGINLMDEEKLKAHTGYVSRKDADIFAHFDMQTLSYAQTRWLRQKTGLS
jgi:hypothetical protein